MKIISVVGARPNFMKIAPFARAINAYNETEKESIQHIIVHTGQHYNARMSETFFEELGIPAPDYNLGIGSGSHAEQVGQTMIAFEKVLQTEKPDWVVVVGDVNATLACSITAKKEWVKCCHIEAGLRSGDLRMPEEVNRLVTDRLADLLLTPDRMSSKNLSNEGVPEEKIVFVGNIMIDTLEFNREKAAGLSYPEILKENIFIKNQNRLNAFNAARRFGLITMHRPTNVDDKQIFSEIADWICDDAAKQIPLIWPIHPRAVKQAQSFGIWQKLIDCEHLLLLNPIGYLEMLKLNMDSQVMLTDSGGLQEECCVLGTPFLTLRWNTERPITLLSNGGAGYLVGNSIENIKRDFNLIIDKYREPIRPELWDGAAAERCLNAIVNYRTIE